MLNTFAPSAIFKVSAQASLRVRFFSNHYGRGIARNAVHENQLHRILINSPPHPYTQLAAHEWRSRTGVGDMVFQKPGTNEFLVVEAKLLKRWHQKHIVKARIEKGQEQATRYGRDWKAMHPSAFVKYATFTNRDGLMPLGELP